MDRFDPCHGDQTFGFGLSIGLDTDDQRQILDLGPYHDHDVDSHAIYWEGEDSEK